MISWIAHFNTKVQVKLEVVKSCVVSGRRRSTCRSFWAFAQFIIVKCKHEQNVNLRTSYRNCCEMQTMEQNINLFTSCLRTQLSSFSVFTLCALPPVVSFVRWAIFWQGRIPFCQEEHLNRLVKVRELLTWNFGCSVGHCHCQLLQYFIEFYWLQGFGKNST